MISEQDWRVGRAIKGYSGMFPKSLCATVFKSGRRDGYHDVRAIPEGGANYLTPNELSVFAFPVEWRSEVAAGRIGVLTISSRDANGITEELLTVLDLLANIIGFLFSLYAVHDRKKLEQEGITIPDGERKGHGFPDDMPHTEEGKRFVDAVVGLRRFVAGHFERRLLAYKTHKIADKRLYYSNSEISGSQNDNR